MTDREAMKMALEAFENPYSGWIQREKNAREALRQALAQPEQDWDLLAATQESLREHQARIKELEAQLAQPEQEELIQFKDGKWYYVRKPWVGLTDEERNEMRSIVQGHTRIDAPTYGLTLQYATEEVLKEKNGG